ncbi:MAG: hypothetical protein ACREPT_06500 [Rudaea sp.]
MNDESNAAARVARSAGGEWNESMENTLNYQFNYSAPPLAAPPPKADPNAPTFASEDGLVASLSSQECIFQVRRTGEPHVMTFQVLQAMDQCREFRTLDEHVARIQSTLPALAGKRDDVKRVLESLLQRELLVSASAFVERFGTATARVPEPLRAVFIRACDRPEQLAHLLASLTEYERRFQAGRHYVLLDDSVLQASVNEQRDLLREFARATGCKINYVGHAERGKIIEKLIKASPAAKAVVESLLARDKHAQTQRFGGGRGMNLALLLSAGARLAVLDDDLRLPLKRSEFARSGLDPDPNARARVLFHANMEETMASGSEIAGDPFELNLAACGHALGSLADYPLDHSALRGLNLSRLNLIKGEARIVATQLGSYGSSRTASGLWLYELNPANRKELWRERAEYLRNIEAQHIWYGVAQARLLVSSGFTPFAMDNSQLLPCTNPLGRGEDSLHGALICYCHPDALTLELPEAVGHVQESARKRSDRTQSVYTPQVNYFLRDYVMRQFGLFKAADPGQRLRFMAEVLRDLAGASTADRIDHLREYLGYVRANTIDRLQHQIESAEGAPLYWQADVRAIVEANAKALLSKVPPRLEDWPQDIDDAGCAKALVAELDGMANALEHWPALWQHAAEQGEKLLSAL